MSIETGQALGPFEIVSLLGAGGMGEVYRARDSRLGRDVALKVIAERFGEDEAALERFRREGRAVAALTHPNIRAIFDIGESDGRTYAVMELLEGQALDERIQAGAMDWRSAVSMMVPVCEGLAAAHSKGIVHRDIKPANIFVTDDGHAKILDFGIARLTEAGSGGPSGETLATVATQAGTSLGTVQYMSPEQVRGERADVRSDVFSVGCTLYEMLTQSRLFERGSVAETMAAIMNDEALPEIERRVNGPRELQRIIAHCLEKSPVRRFQSARDIAFALQGVTETDQTPSLGSKSGGFGTQKVNPSVAVLPFANMSADKENEYFSDGLAEELLNNLTKIHDLQVASRTSSFAFKGRNEDIRTIAERLNVQHILEGSVRRAGNRLRVTAQLVNAADGYHLWSETYDRTMEDVFAVQDEIAQSISKALRVVLTEKEKDQLSRLPTNNIAAYDLYLKGRQLISEWGGDGLRKARRLFRRATELDENFALAFAGLADACSQLYIFCESHPDYAREAEEASQKALRLQPDLPEAHVSRGTALALTKQYEESLREFDLAVKSNPDHSEAHYYLGRSLFGQGKFEEAARAFERACDLNPDDVQAPSVLAMCYERMDDPQRTEIARRRTVAAAERYLELVPDDPRALYLAAIDLIALGETDKGLGWAERALALKPNEQIVCYNVACAHATLGNTDRAIQLLERTVLSAGYGVREWIEKDPDLDSLREDPRFIALLKLLDDREEMRRAQLEGE